MKTLIIPDPVYNYYETSGISKTLQGIYSSKQKTKQGFSLYGAYKKIRVMPLFAGLGDFEILSSCISFLRSKNIFPTETEIRRTMLYFQPSLSVSERKALMKTFFDSFLIVPATDNMPLKRKEKNLNDSSSIKTYLTHNL